MTQKDFLNSVQKSCHLEHQQCTMLLNALSRLMAKAGVEQVPVTLPGLGTFTSHKHPEYIEEDPETGRQTLYPPRISYRMQTEDEDAQRDLLEKQLAENAKTPVDETSSFLAAFVENLLSALDKGEDVEVKGIGTFKVINSNQGEIQRVAYTPDEQMKQLVNAPFNCFQPVVINAHIAPVAVAVEEEKTEVEETPIIPPIQEATSADVSPDPVAPVAPIKEEAKPVEETAETPEPEPKEEEVVIEEPKVVVSPTPAPVVEHVKAEKQETSIAAASSSYLDEQDEENGKKSRTVLYTFLGLCVIILGALAWFLLGLNKEKVEPNVEVVQEPVIEEEPSTEVFFGQDGTVEAETVVAPQEENAAAVIENVEKEKKVDNKTAEVASTQKPSVVAAAATSSAEQAKQATQTQPAKPAATPVKAETEVKKETQEPATTQEKGEKKTANVAGRLKNADGTYATYELKAGERLTLVSLAHYGDKCFWPYIYEVNKDKLKSPSVVPVGMVLYLPDPAYFGIDVKNPESVQKAKNKAAALINSK
jgi:nucleoid DNA-binding protein